ncbi:MAG TPA: hypothetical protein V6D29_04795 [Leptolyngbyaceae cyanobacterium]
MYTSQFLEFRRQYPTACLSTDLLAIHENLYVIRAQVSLDEKLLATGMAADAVLETAEDRACARVLQRLGLDSLTAVETTLSGVQNPPQITPSAPVNEPVLPVSPDPPSQLPQQEFLFPDPEEEFISVDWEEEPELLPLTTPVTSSLDEPDILQPEPVAVSRGDNSRTQTKTNGRADAIAPTPTPQPSPKLSPLPSNPPPVDLSDIIAQTDVELRRLGWNVAQGREFLERTYGKRSRHDLTDQELLAFLLYLEMQPSP